MKKLFLVLVLGLVLISSTVFAEPLSTAKLAWMPPVSTAEGLPLVGDLALTDYKIYCGASSGSYAVTKNVGLVVEYKASDVPLTIGVWFCVVTALNQYGESAYSNEKQFTLEGSVPASPTNLIVK